MASLSAVPDTITEIERELKRRGIGIDEVVLGDAELTDMSEWIEPRYVQSIYDAIESRVPFFWHGIRIVPARDRHAFTIVASG